MKVRKEKKDSRTVYRSTINPNMYIKELHGDYRVYDESTSTPNVAVYVGDSLENTIDWIEMITMSA